MERALGSVPVTLPGGGRDWRGQDALLLLEQPWRGEGPSSVTTGKATLRSQAAPRSPKLKASRFLSRSWDTPITVETPRTQGHHGRKTRETWRWGAGPLKAAAPPPREPCVTQLSSTGHTGCTARRKGTRSCPVWTESPDYVGTASGGRLGGGDLSLFGLRGRAEALSGPTPWGPG